MPWESTPVHLDNEQRQQLKRIAGSKKVAEKLRCRALIVLLLNEGLSNSDIAHRLSVHENTVVKWRMRWAGNNTDAHINDYGVLTGRPRTQITEELIERLKKVIASPPPADKKRWTVRSLAKALNLSTSTTQRALKESKTVLHRRRKKRTSSNP